MSEDIQQNLEKIFQSYGVLSRDAMFIAAEILTQFLVIPHEDVGTEQGFPHSFGPIESRNIWRGPWTNSLQNHESAP